jgi:hypothetical protein
VTAPTISAETRTPGGRLAGPPDYDTVLTRVIADVLPCASRAIIAWLFDQGTLSATT